jgi:hypothetical protein
MKTVKLSTLVCFVMLYSMNFVHAQSETNLTKAQISNVIDSIGSILNTNYVFPEVAKKMTSLVKTNYKKGSYATITDPQALASTLTNDLQSISHDKHLRVIYNPQQIAAQERVVTPEDSIAYIENRVNQMKFQNFGFKEVKILDGNIGYLDLRAFMNTEHASETAVAAMNFLSSASVIIIDLRNNGGGSPSMIQLITSYLYPARRIHLNNFLGLPI